MILRETTSVALTRLALLCVAVMLVLMGLAANRVWAAETAAAAPVEHKAVAGDENSDAMATASMSKPRSMTCDESAPKADTSAAGFSMADALIAPRHTVVPEETP
jgi:hypothetical protein